MTQYVGIDFGTTNSAVAITGSHGPARLTEFPTADGGVTTTWRTILYFDAHVEPGQDDVQAGTPAIERYVDSDGDGRLIQSIKSYLASASFSRTAVLGRTWSLEQLVAAYLTRLRVAAGLERGARIVMGRPVCYWGAKTAEDDARAIERMRTALTLAGFADVEFEFEPVAAAARYGHSINHNEVVLIADFGGGTSDFSLVNVGPNVDPRDGSAILATGGIGVGGDTFDGRMVDAVIAPLLGKHTGFRDAFGKEMPIPPWIYSNLRRWHHLSFLKSPKTSRLLGRVRRGAVDPERVERLLWVINNDLGFALHRAVESTKSTLSAQQDAHLGLEDPPFSLAADVQRHSFEQWIEPDLAQIDTVVDDVLTRAGLDAAQVDRVFTTGGSSFVPAIRARLSARFGDDKLLGGNELTSVASGLAIRARQLFS